MNLLIVDDEVIAVKGVIEGVCWGNLNFEEVFVANSMAQAIDLFLNNPIEIMLCDIEMPQGSGLDLLRWVRRERPDTECIFLTCHADFQFAKEALQLGTLDYLLKPMPYQQLEATLKSAKQRVEEKQHQKRLMQAGTGWVSEIAQMADAGRHQSVKRKPADIVAEVAGYIRGHLSDELSAEMLSRQVYLNPDYLTDRKSVV